ncbi:MAG TPA: hypothetical protein VN222_06125 [Novosphingobium sp.]|nr:hypothetical protein [Novosphingobium sp.]
MDCATYIRRETLVSIAINTTLTALFFAVVFGFVRPVPVWGAGHYVLDFGPQAFMIALMATLVPGTLARKARRSGKVARWPVAPALPQGLWARALLLAVGASCLAMAGVGALMWLAGLSQLPVMPAFMAKLAFAVALAALITPAGLKAALAE